MSKYLLIILVLLSTVALITNSVSHHTTQQDTYIIVGVVTLKCSVRNEDVVVVLENTHDKEFVILGVETVPSRAGEVILPHLLGPKNTTYILLEGVGELSKVLVFLVDPETNTSLVMACVP